MLSSLLLKLDSLHNYVCQRYILTYSPKEPMGRWLQCSGGTSRGIRGDMPKAEGWLGEQEGPASWGQGCHSCRDLPLLLQWQLLSCMGPRWLFFAASGHTPFPKTIFCYMCAVSITLIIISNTDVKYGRETPLVGWV